MELYQSFVEKIGVLFEMFYKKIEENPELAGLVLGLWALVFMIGAILDKNWAIEGPSSRNRYLLIGIIGRFGARVFVVIWSVIVIGFGVYIFIRFS